MILLRYFVVSDIHSYYTLTLKALKEAHYDESNPNHKLIVCGDIFDRGDESIAIYNWLKRLKMEDKVILIKGNHEDLLTRIYKSRQVMKHDYHNQTTKTIIDLIKEYTDKNISEIDLKIPGILIYCLNILEEKGVFSFISEFLDFFETKNYIFTHGFLPSQMNTDVSGGLFKTIKQNWRNCTKEEWERARWDNAQKMVLQEGVIPPKTIVCGHVSSSYGHALTKKISEFGIDACYDIFQTKELIAVDGCTAYSKRVNVLVLEEVD